MNKKFIFTYKTTNKKNGRFYIGVHETDDLEDGYLGSGFILNRAINKHGSENFEREILKFHSSKDEAFSHEKELVTPELVKSSKSYNIALGGNGGNTTEGFTVEQKEALSYKKSMSSHGINCGEKNVMFGKSPKEVYSPEVYEKWKVNNAIARRGAGNGMFNIRPWEHPVATKENIKIWLHADEYFHVWKADKNIGAVRLAARLIAAGSNIKYSRSGHNKLIEKFRSGYIPWKDIEWIQFKRASVERIPIYFTSDLHLFHTNVIEYSKRPFLNVEEMHTTLIKRWNATVPSYGVVYVLGDVGFSNIDKLKTVLDELHGILILICGNHDPSSNFLYKAGFSAVINSGTLYISNERVEMNHCPPRGIFREDTTNMKGSNGKENWHGETKNTRFTRDYDNNCFWLHGHTHKSPKERTLNRMFDVGVDANNFTPVSISQIESWITKTKAEEAKLTSI